jgi:type IV pilus assembly protein PilE
MRNGGDPVMRSKSSGFTLVELMITVVIIAILSSIAVPAYRSYVQRSRRSEATSALLRIQAAQEKFFLQNNAYSANLVGAPPAGLGMLNTTDSGNYDLVLAPAGAGYTATATATSTQADDAKCVTFTINPNGVRSATGSATNPTVECWK